MYLVWHCTGRFPQEAPSTPHRWSSTVLSMSALIMASCTPLVLAQEHPCGRPLLPLVALSSPHRRSSMVSSTSAHLTTSYMPLMPTREKPYGPLSLTTLFIPHRWSLMVSFILALMMASYTHSMLQGVEAPRVYPCGLLRLAALSSLHRQLL